MRSAQKLHGRPPSFPTTALPPLRQRYHRRATRPLPHRTRYHANVTMMRSKAEVVRKQRAAADAKEEAEAQAVVQRQLEEAAAAHGGDLPYEERAVILQVRGEWSTNTHTRTGACVHRRPNGWRAAPKAHRAACCSRGPLQRPHR